MLQLYNKIVNRNKYHNFVEAQNKSIDFRRFTGSVFYPECNPNNKVVIKVSKIGVVCFIIWCSSYFYCTYTTYMEGQSLLRSIYDTKLKHYGDAFEWVASIIYVVYCLWKVFFQLSGNSMLFQNLIDIDLAIKDLGTEIDYNKDANTVFAISLGQLGVYLMRFLCIWSIVNNLNDKVPMEKIFQVICSDSLALIITTYNSIYLIIMKSRIKLINKAMVDIKMKRPCVFKVLVRNKTSVLAPKLQNRTDCDKVKLCAKAYGMIYEACEFYNNFFGFALLLTFIIYLNIITLYMFYFMEVTAMGMFHDVQRYMVFIVLFLWQIAYALTIIFLNVYFCESVKKEAAKITITLHEILNADLDSNVSTQAMHFSTQMLHQTPVFTACGLFDLDFELLRTGAQTVSTYLIILLQFAITEE